MSTPAVSAGESPLLAARNARGWSRARAAQAVLSAGQARGEAVPSVDSVMKSLARHEKGVTKPNGLYLGLYEAVFGLTRQQITGETTGQAVAGDGRITSDKFLMAYIGPDAATRLCEAVGAVPMQRAWFPGDSCAVDTPFGRAQVIVWKHGAVAVHLRERSDCSSIADVAVWRVASYVENLAWYSGFLAGHGVEVASEPYVFSSYWVDRALWAGADAVAAAHLLASPKTLLTREGGDSASVEQARLIEANLIGEGFRHPNVTEFGIPGISVGAASWSGIAYLPIAEGRTLKRAELAAVMMAVQSVWVTCGHIVRAVQEWQTPLIDPVEGIKTLKRCRTRLCLPLSGEEGQHQQMREAIVATSDVARMIDHAIDALESEL